jgi:hypothetical protein
MKQQKQGQNKFTKRGTNFGNNFVMLKGYMHGMV